LPLSFISRLAPLLGYLKNSLSVIFTPRGLGQFLDFGGSAPIMLRNGIHYRSFAR
jgi:hypothetical protein